MSKTKKRSRTVPPRKYQYVLVSPTTTFESSFPKNRTGVCSSQGSIVKAASQVDKNSIWISETAKRTEELSDTLGKFYGNKFGNGGFGNLITLEKLKQPSVTLLSGWFDGICETKSALPKDELAEVLLLPVEERKDLFIGGSVLPLMKRIILIRGDLSSMLVPFSMFPPSPQVKPNFRRFGVGDYGNTLQFGNYESSADVVLWEMDADYRKRTKAKENLTAKGLGPALRRLRIQRRLSQSDFRDIDRRTISRIENGEIENPQRNTLETIAKQLNVKPGEIETY